MDKAPEPPAGWRSAIRGNVLMMGFVSLLTDFSSEMINPLLPVFFAFLAGGAKAALWVGLSEGIAETTASLLKLFSGRLSDRLGKRKALVLVGYGLSAVSRPLIALVGAGVAGAVQVVALKFADRVGKGVRTSPRDALIGDSIGPEYRGLAFSVHRMMDHIGAILGPLVAIAMLYSLLGYAHWAKPLMEGTLLVEEETALRKIFAVALIPGILAMVVLAVKVREIVPKSPSPQPGEGLSRVSVWKQLPRRFYAFVAVVTLFALGNSSDMFLLLYAWTLFRLDLIVLPILWIVLHISKAVFSIPGGMLSDRIGRRPVIITGWIVYALVYLGMAQMRPETPVWTFWALFVAYGFYYGMTEGAEKALVADFVSSENRGTAFGVYHGAVGIAALPASLVFGWIWASLGSGVAFAIGAALAGAAACGMLLLALTDKPKKTRSDSMA